MVGLRNGMWSIVVEIMFSMPLGCSLIRTTKGVEMQSGHEEWMWTCGVVDISISLGRLVGNCLWREESHSVWGRQPFTSPNGFMILPVVDLCVDSDSRWMLLLLGRNLWGGKIHNFRSGSPKELVDFHGLLPILGTGKSTSTVALTGMKNWQLSDLNGVSKNDSYLTLKNAKFQAVHSWKTKSLRWIT